jgi:hypothetical protein
MTFKKKSLGKIDPTIRYYAVFASDVPYCRGPTSLKTQEQSNSKDRVVSLEDSSLEYEKCVKT